MANNNKLNTRIVLRNDSSTNWLANETQVLLKGEVGIEFLDTGKVKMKIGDGVKSWAQLPYFGGDECHVFEATVSTGGSHSDAITTAVGETSLNKGDIAIVKEAIVDEDKITGTVTQKYKYTAYIYGDVAGGITDWKAMDGNYDASNVYFNDDFTFTTNIGTVTGVSGSKTVAAAGKSVKDFLAGLFAKEEAGSITAQPSCSITLSGAGDYEVGTTVNPSYTTSFNAGSYKYGPSPTGVEVSSWSVKSNDGKEVFDTAKDTCSSFVVSDGTDYYLTATVTHTEGSLAKSNIGNEGTVKIASGTKTASSSHIKGHRKHFYGALVTPIDLTSANIRDLTKTTENSFTITIPEGTKQVVIALYNKILKKVADTVAFGTDIVANFTEVTSEEGNEISVAGANNYTGVNYKVYEYRPETALGANEYNVTIG